MKKEAAAKKTFNIYGAEIPDTPQSRTIFNNELHRELFFFREAHNIQAKIGDRYTGGGRFEHAKNLIRIIWKDKVDWHSFMESTVAEYCGGTREVIVTGPGSAGKCLAPNTPVLMFDGSIKKAKEICVGDKLMGDDSSERNVLSANVGKSNMVRIIPQSGDPWECNDDHILSLKRTEGRRNSWRRKYEIVDISVKDYLNKSQSFKDTHKLFCVPVEFPKQEIDFDPQFYGIWLGDGDTGRSGITVHDSEVEILNYLKKFSDENGYLMRRQKDGLRCPRHSFVPIKNKSDGDRNPLLNFIRESCCGSGGKKRILKRYLHNTREIRLAVLAGIIDADGNSSKTSFEISSSLEELSEDIAYLARSLGFRVKKTKRSTSFTYLGVKKHRDSYRIRISGNVSEIPTLRKKCSQKKLRINSDCTGFKIEQLGVGEWSGFTLDGNHRFLLGDFTVTHNTYGAGLYALLFLMCDPLNSGVLISSTTMRGLRQRIWSDVKRLYQWMPPELRSWNLIDQPFPALQPVRGDLKHGIIGIAVESGNEESAMDRIIGFHPPRILVVVDELTGVPWTIIKATVNLFTGKREAQFIGLGNASSIFDSHGKMCEPKEGWSSVTVESEKWKTKRGGVCVHLDGFKSPNIIEGRTVYPYLLTKADIDQTARDYGMNSLDMWRFRRGFWCPEGTVKSIMSETLLNKFRAMDTVTWRENYTRCASLDPAFEGGDKCVLKLGRYGVSTEGVNTLLFDDTIIIKTDATAKDPIHYQIAKQVKDICTSKGVEPINFGMDVTGEGGGLASIISETWQSTFHHVEFGGRPSEMQVSVTDKRSCRDVYHNKVTELWYSFRECVQNGQIRGLDAETAVEFCNRIYFAEGKIRVESKSDMKSRPNGKSPDRADSAAVLCDLVKHRGGFGKLQSKAANSAAREWNKLIEEFTIDDNYSSDPIEAL